ncbi:hypothetical protein RHMOL_Rhmol09G0154600 [Rhododendron molle]|uniref:Uncharacterized protein n=1 Tax=Rhododendron molle TaxID=49168 RepID=A0ACC0MDI6_RHOML|nr:hypothetical protein RHMOL_Rhmol09G0154600 [Rhododendron molle]
MTQEVTKKSKTTEAPMTYEYYYPVGTEIVGTAALGHLRPPDGISELFKNSK